MHTIRPCLAAIMLGLGSQSAYALNLDIDYSTYDSNGFFSDGSRINAFEAAASFFETRIGDTLLPIVSTPGGDRYTAIVSTPDTNIVTSLANFNIAADTIKIFVGGRNLGSSILAIGGPGGYNINLSNQNYIDDSVSRGQGDGTESAVTGTSANDFATWGGSISFNTISNWYFDDTPDTDESFSGFDFFSVALHEIAHLLGFGTADSWSNQVASNVFIGSESVATFGGNVPLETVAASEVPGHWAPGTKIDGVETAMDPNIAAGTRKHFTSLDIAGLRDVGWEMSATVVPIPGAVWLFGSGILGLVGLSQRKQTSR